MSSRRIPIEWQQAEIYPSPGTSRLQPGSNLARLRRTILALPVNADVCVLEHSADTHVYLAARQVGAHVRLRKDERGGYKVFRVS